MAKRARGSVRPGQRRPIDRRPASATGSSSATPRPTGLSQAELERAEQLEKELLAQERAAEQARTRSVRRETTREVVEPASSLSFAAQEAKEYAYVARDVKDIVRIASLLFAILFVLWIVIDVLPGG